MIVSSILRFCGVETLSFNLSRTMKLGDWNVPLKRRRLRLLDRFIRLCCETERKRYGPSNPHFIGAGRAARLSQLESHRVGQLINSNIVTEHRMPKKTKTLLTTSFYYDNRRAVGFTVCRAQSYFFALPNAAS